MMWLSGLLIAASVVAAAAKEFPLELKSLTLQEAITCPGGHGSYSQLGVAKPQHITKEPKAKSAHPLYGQFQNPPDTKGFCFRLDESQGDGKGYDQLIIDLNQNGDLTDDPVGRRAESPESPRVQPGGFEQARFGPIQAGTAQRVGAWQPRYYAEMYLYHRQFNNALSRMNYLGQLSLRAGYYLQATVDLEGSQERIALLDGNCNNKLGEASRQFTFRGDEGEQVYFQGGDALLRDRDGSGTFESDAFQREAELLGKIHYFGARPYQVQVTPDFKAIHLAPYAKGMGEMQLAPQSSQIAQFSLAWEATPGQWQQIFPALVQGKARLPAGNYRLYHCLLAGKTPDNQQVMTMGYQRSIKDTIKVEEGQTATVKCGAPLELRVAAEKRKAGGVSSGGGVMNTIANWWSKVRSDAFELKINLAVMGAGGEAYSGYTKGKGMLPPPTFKILDTESKLIASGNLEFG